VYKLTEACICILMQITCMLMLFCILSRCNYVDSYCRRDVVLNHSCALTFLFDAVINQSVSLYTVSRKNKLFLKCRQIMITFIKLQQVLSEFAPDRDSRVSCHERMTITRVLH